MNNEDSIPLPVEVDSDGSDSGKSGTQCKIRLTFTDQHHHTNDLLKKLKGDCIKDGNMERYTMLYEQLANFHKVCSSVFPCISHEFGTLSLHVQVEDESEMDQCSSHKQEGKPITTCSSDSDITAEDIGSSDVPMKSHVPFDKLKVAQREPSKINEIADLIDLRQGPDNSPLLEDICEIRGKCCENVHAQATKTPVSTGPGPRGGFVDLNPYQSLPLPKDLLRSLSMTVDDQKETHTLLGQGGLGKVFMVHPKYAFADKQIDLKFRRTTLEDARREAEIMKHLDHPNIMGSFGSHYDTRQQVFHLFLEWMRGGSLRKLISDRGPFVDDYIVQFSHDLLTGLAYLHENGIVHRDIKADNLLIDGSGKLKIGDFGHALRLKDVRALRCAEGTIPYMAPEYARGELYTCACDIWSAGMVILEMATGSLPWSQYAADDYSLMFRIGSLKEALVIPDFLPHDIRDLLELCLQLDADKRPSARELIQHPVFQALDSRNAEWCKSPNLVSVVSAVCATPLVAPECVF